MENRFIKTVQNSVKHWYLPLISGLILIGMGLFTFNYQLASYVALSLLFSLSFLFSGAFEIIFSISNKNEMENWGWTLAFGLVSFIMGILLLIHPEISLTTLPLYVGFTILFRSISAIGYSLELKNYKVLGWAYLLILGILGVLFSLLLIRNPILSGMTIVIYTGISFLVSGIFSVFLSFKLKRINSLSKE